MAKEMKEDFKLSEIRTMKIMLEDKIAEAIALFSRTTGLRVSGVSLTFSRLDGLLVEKFDPNNRKEDVVEISAEIQIQI